MVVCVCIDGIITCGVEKSMAKIESGAETQILF